MSDFDGKIEFEKFPPAYRLMIKYTELENRIDRAIEYIEKSDDNENSYGDYDIEYHFKKELLDILKGSDKE